MRYRPVRFFIKLPPGKVSEAGIDIVGFLPEEDKTAGPGLFLRLQNAFLIAGGANQMVGSDNKDIFRRLEIHTGQDDRRGGLSGLFLKDAAEGDTLKSLHLVQDDVATGIIRDDDKLVTVGHVAGKRLLKQGMVLLDTDKLFREIRAGERPEALALPAGENQALHNSSVLPPSFRASTMRLTSWARSFGHTITASGVSTMTRFSTSTAATVLEEE